MKLQIELPPLERLQEMFELAPETPNGLRWKKKASRNTVIGTPAGRLSVNGYWEVRLDKVLYKSSRIVYKMYNDGLDPIGFEVDHYDRNKSNNAGSNLILATRGEQQSNCHVRGTVPYRNVCVDNRHEKRYRPYQSSVSKVKAGEPKMKFLGYFSNPYEAAVAAIVYKRLSGMRYEFAPGGTK